MPDDDRYPPETGRRRFVRGVVGSGVLAGAGTTGTAALEATTERPGTGGGSTTYFGIENTAGPAPRGMPVIPLAVDDGGYLVGRFPEWETVVRDDREIRVAETEIAGYTYDSRWFQYCGVQRAPGLQPGTDERDEYVRYASGAPYEWQRRRVDPGARMHVDDFADYETWGNEVGADGIGKPAKGTWRSRGVDEEGTIPVQVLRIPPDRFEEMLATSAHPDWLEAATAERFVAWLDKCTHFCCVPSFKGTTRSARFDAEDRVYCSCHQSVYDPYRVVRESFVALPRPE